MANVLEDLDIRKIQTDCGDHTKGNHPDRWQKTFATWCVNTDEDADIHVKMFIELEIAVSPGAKRRSVK